MKILNKILDAIGYGVSWVVEYVNIVFYYIFCVICYIPSYFYLRSSEQDTGLFYGIFIGQFVVPIIIYWRVTESFMWQERTVMSGGALGECLGWTMTLLASIFVCLPLMFAAKCCEDKDMEDIAKKYMKYTEDSDSDFEPY